MVLAPISFALAQSAAPPPLPPDARFALALFCDPTCDDAVFDAIDASLANIPAKDGFPESATKAVRVMGLAGTEFGIPDAAVIAEFGVAVDRPEALASSKEVLLAFFAAPRTDAPATFAAAHAAFALAAERANGWVYDLDSEAIYGLEAWRARDPRGDRQAWFVVDGEPMDAAKPDGAVRLVTRGLRRFGDFELLVEDVAPDDAPDVSYVLNAVAETLAGRASVASTITVSTNTVRGTATLTPARRRETDPEDPLLRVRFEGDVTVPVLPGEAPPADDAPPPDVPAPPSDAAPAEGLALPATPAPAEVLALPATPAPAVAAPAGPTPLDAARTAARARFFGPVRQAFDAGLPAGAAIAAKAPFTARSGATEYMWVEVRGWSDAAIVGTLLNDPWDVEGLAKGQTVTLRPEDVFDYVWKKGDGTKEGNTTAAHLK